jgi:hypothetical protein
MKTSTALLLLAVLLLSVSSCNKSNETNTIDYTENPPLEVSIDSILTDTSRVLMADFPVFFDSTRVLIHPIGFVSVEIDRSGSRYFSKKEYNSTDYKVAYRSENTISGNMTYIVIEDVDNNITRPLSNKVLNITNIMYLRDLARKTGRHYLLYTVQDMDTNRDGKVDRKDITTFYVSKLDGTAFTKISPDYHEIEDGGWKSWCQRYYYRTLEDVNKDGKFDKRDKYHYFYIDFSIEPYKVVEYNPLNEVLK